jgi:hypothetical protein
VAHTCNPSYLGGLQFQASPGTRPYLEKPFTKIGLVEWLKVKALSSSPSSEKKKSNKILRKMLTALPVTVSGSDQCH